MSYITDLPDELLEMICLPLLGTPGFGHNIYKDLLSLSLSNRRFPNVVRDVMFRSGTLIVPSAKIYRLIPTFIKYPHFAREIQSLDVNTTPTPMSNVDLDKDLVQSIISIILKSKTGQNWPNIWTYHFAYMKHLDTILLAVLIALLPSLKEVSWGPFTPVVTPIGIKAVQDYLQETIDGIAPQLRKFGAPWPGRFNLAPSLSMTSAALKTLVIRTGASSFDLGQWLRDTKSVETIVLTGENLLSFRLWDIILAVPTLRNISIHITGDDEGVFATNVLLLAFFQRRTLRTRGININLYLRNPPQHGHLPTEQPWRLTEKQLQSIGYDRILLPSDRY